jgi:mono/diheme cytochrome c family protein
MMNDSINKFRFSQPEETVMELGVKQTRHREGTMRTTIFSLCFSLLIGLPIFSLAMASENPDLQAGAEIHQTKCASCHGEDGKGDGRASKLLKVKPADWTDSERMSDVSDEDLFSIIKKGGEALGKSKLMPPFEAKLKDDQITDLVAFIKSLREPIE